MPGQAGQKGEAAKRLCQLPPEASTVTDSCRFNPSQPPKGGAINARALSSLRITVGAKNPRHNITQHCIRKATANMMIGRIYFEKMRLKLTALIFVTTRPHKQA